MKLAVLLLQFAVVLCGDEEYRCPVGSYLGKTVAVKNGKIKSKQWSWKAAGWSPISRLGHHHEQTHTSTLCASNWALPPSCQSTAHRADTVTRQPDQFGSHLEFVHNFKVAGSSLTPYFNCEYGKSSSGPAHGHVTIFVVRDPIDRFISACGELLQRYVNNLCPGHKTCGISEGAKTGAKWYEKWRRNQHDLKGLVAAFVNDARCCSKASALEHFSSQSTFAATATRPIDMVIHLDKLNEGLDKLANRLQHRNTCGRPAHHNSYSDKPQHQLPSPQQLRSALNEQPPLMRQLCDVYYQDFVCFDLPFPSVCKH